jgi:hypothetical protein
VPWSLLISMRATPPARWAARTARARSRSLKILRRRGRRRGCGPGGGRGVGIVLQSHNCTMTRANALHGFGGCGKPLRRPGRGYAGLDGMLATVVYWRPQVRAFESPYDKNWLVWGVGQC